MARYLLIESWHTGQTIDSTQLHEDLPRPDPRSTSATVLPPLPPPPQASQQHLPVEFRESAAFTQSRLKRAREKQERDKQAAAQLDDHGIVPTKIVSKEQQQKAKLVFCVDDWDDIKAGCADDADIEIVGVYKKQKHAGASK